MKLYLVRHAHAESRSAWSGDDRLRPLSKKGRRQATDVADVLAGAGVSRLVSSPSIRCIETLRPLADRAGLEIESDDRLAEGADGLAALDLAEKLRRAGETAVLCSHGDVIPDLLSELRGTGTMFHDPLTWPKGSVWRLKGNGGDGVRWTDAHYLVPAKV